MPDYPRSARLLSAAGGGSNDFSWATKPSGIIAPDPSEGSSHSALVERLDSLISILEKAQKNHQQKQNKPTAQDVEDDWNATKDALNRRPSLFSQLVKLTAQKTGTSDIHSALTNKDSSSGKKLLDLARTAADRAGVEDFFDVITNHFAQQRTLAKTLSAKSAAGSTGDLATREIISASETLKTASQDLAGAARSLEKQSALTIEDREYNREEAFRKRLNEEQSKHTVTGSPTSTNFGSSDTQSSDKNSISGKIAEAVSTSVIEATLGAAAGTTLLGAVKGKLSSVFGKAKGLFGGNAAEGAAEGVESAGASSLIKNEGRLAPILEHLPGRYKVLGGLAAAGLTAYGASKVFGHSSNNNASSSPSAAGVSQFAGASPLSGAIGISPSMSTTAAVVGGTAAAEFGGMALASKIAGKGLGKVLGPIGMILSGYQAWETLQKLYGRKQVDPNYSDAAFKRDFSSEIGKLIGGTGGSALLAELGGVLGGAIGLEGGPLAIATGLIGGVGGGALGYFAGDWAGGKMGDLIYDTFLKGKPLPDKSTVKAKITSSSPTNEQVLAQLANPPSTSSSTAATSGVSSGSVISSVGTSSSRPNYAAPQGLISSQVHASSARLKNNQSEAYNAAISAGLSDKAARSLVANFSGESLSNPGDVHGDVKADGTFAHVARGIVQWDPARSAAIKAHFGKNPNEMTVAEQTQAAIWELQTNPKYAKTWQALQGTDADAMLSSLVSNYERPADAVTALSQRSGFFNSLPSQLGSTAPGNSEAAATITATTQHFSQAEPSSKQPTQVAVIQTHQNDRGPSGPTLNSSYEFNPLLSMINNGMFTAG